MGKKSHDIRMLCIEKEIEFARSQAVSLNKSQSSILFLLRICLFCFSERDKCLQLTDVNEVSLENRQFFKHKTRSPLHHLYAALLPIAQFFR